MKNFKNYKNAVPLLLVMLMALSIYSLVDTVKTQKTKYLQYLEEAREYAGFELVEDAVASYHKALEIDKDLEVSLEVGALYVKSELDDDAVSWGEDMVDTFEQKPEAYEFLLQQYYRIGDYEACFSLNDKAIKRETVNDGFGKLIQSMQYAYNIEFSTYKDVSIFSGEHCAVYKNDRWGYVNLTGTMVIENRFLEGGEFVGNLAAVQDEDGDRYYITTNGNKKLAVKNLSKCEYLGPIIDDTLVAYDGKSYGYYDADFVKKIDKTYTYASSMNNGIAAIQNEDGIWSFINSTGDVITSKNYNAIAMDERKVVFHNERAFAQRDGIYYMLDINGKELPKVQFEDAKTFLPDSLYAAVKAGGKWGFVDKDGKMKITPQYDDARSFSNGIAAVKVNGLWGFIDTSGKMVIETQFDDARDCNSKGCLFVKTLDEWRLLKLYKDNH